MRTARYARLNIMTPAQTTDGAARIYELEVYGTVGGTPTPTRTATPTATTPPTTNLALGRAATGSAACNANEGPAKAVNGSVSGGNADKFCSLTAPRWLQVDLGAAYAVSSFTIRHAGAGGESTTFNTRAFGIQTSTDNAAWTTVVTTTANTANVSNHPITPRSARYVRLNITTPAQDANAAARIYELEVYGTSGTSGAAAWVPSLAYEVGDLATYAGLTYRCTQAHTSQAGWEPPNAPSLWARQ
jgi:hypothetical protein